MPPSGVLLQDILILGRVLSRISLEESTDATVSFLPSKYLQNFCFTLLSTTVYSGTVTLNSGRIYVNKWGIG